MSGPFGGPAGYAPRAHIAHEVAHVGKAGIEGEITDSMSGARLMAVLDERQGTKAVRGGIRTWSDVKLASEFWAERLRKRLATLSRRSID